jgi:hypothetical protein
MKFFLGMGDLGSRTFPVYNLQQPNDYIGWIARGKREETRIKCLSQMFHELKSGDAYSGMKYNARG